MDAACEINVGGESNCNKRFEGNETAKADVLSLNVDLIPSQLPTPSSQSHPDQETINSAEADFVKTILEWNEQQVDKPEKDGPGNERDNIQEEPKTCHMVFEVGIQANDYEIERRSGRLPGRKRLVPFKFRDYRNPDNVDANESDDDYVPKQSEMTVRKIKRRPGRPRKLTTSAAILSTTTDSNSDIANANADSTGDKNPTSTPKMVSTGKINGSKTIGFECDQCSRIFNQKGNLKVHKRCHTDERPFVCNYDQCDKKFRSNEILRRHKLTHEGVKPFECSECKKKFSSKVSLLEHQAIHDNIKPYKCDECGRNFRQVSCFKRHLITHTTETPYVCDICGKSFSQMAYLRSHSKVHTGEKPYPCNVCKKAFAHASDLTRHKILHSGVKPFQCPHCSHRFSDASSCRRHVREHSNAKPYSCNLCGDGFKRTGQLRAHLARRHFNNKDGENVIKEEPEDAIVHIKGFESEAVTSTDSQRKIVCLIKNMNGNIPVRQVEITQPEKNKNQFGDTVYVEEINAASVTDNDLIQLSQAVEVSNHLDIPDQQPVPTTDTHTDKTVIAITDSEAMESLDRGTLPYETLQIIQGLSENSNEQQIYEVHYQGNEEPQKLETQAMESNQVVAPDYVTNPDFSSQEYYNWLSNFTELCKMVPMPLDVSLFQKMSQVHKTLSDVMATPSGVVADKENFRVLMTISRDLNMIISEHLNFVLQNLDEEQIQS